MAAAEVGGDPVPNPKVKSALPVGCMAPLNVEEVALKIEANLAASDDEWFRPIPTGFIDIDRTLGGGLHAGDLCLIGGPQNIGKTSLCLQMARGIGEAGALAVVVNYEHSVETLWERMLCQSAYSESGRTSLTAADLNEAYRSTVRERDGLGAGEGEDIIHYLDRVLDRVPSGLAAWSRLSAIGHRIWLVTGHGSYTTVDALERYLDFAFTTARRVVLVVDYVQEVPVITMERRLASEERIERVLAGLKGLALGFQNQGCALSVVAVAAADAPGLRRGRVHLEDLWGNATIQYKPDVAWVGNLDQARQDGGPVVRWAVEKNRRGPSELEFRFGYHGAAFSFEAEGTSVPPAESWQAERFGRSRAAAVTGAVAKPSL